MALTTLKFAPHALAKVFPEATAAEKRDLQEHIKKNGLEEPVILYEGKILDGRSRAEACAKLGIEPRYAEFMHLAPAIREAGPIQFVIGRNLMRRHLTVSQRAMIAAELLPAFEKKAKERQQSGLTLAPKDANGEVVRGKAAEQAAKTTGVSTRSIERAKRIIKKSPKKAAAIKEGKLTVGRATEDQSAKAQKKAAIEVAISRIETVCGDSFAKAVRDGILLKKSKDILAYAAQTEEEMQTQAGLIELHWPLKKAKLFRTKNLTKNHKIIDLINRAAASGNVLSIMLDNWKIDITRIK